MGRCSGRLGRVRQAGRSFLGRWFRPLSGGRGFAAAVATALLAALPLAAEPTAQEALGWKLFFDPILSRNQTFSCATCHVPEKGYEGGEALSKGVHDDVLGRNTPTVVNLDEAQFFFWDGRAGSLEEQAKGPIENPLEMDLTLGEAVERVKAQPRYRKAFEKIGRPIDEDSIVAAIAAFERKLKTGPAVFDRWINGDRSALNEQQERGRMIFFTKGDCALCHNGLNLTDDDFHNIGTAAHGDDVGRYALEEEDYFLGAFKTPALRNWKGREPFMHDGRFATLREVLEFYSDPGENPLGESEVEPLNLTGDEIDDLIAFMETLNGEWPDLEPFERKWKELGVE